MKKINYSELLDDFDLDTENKVATSQKFLNKKRKGGNEMASTYNAKQLLEDNGNIYVYSLKGEGSEHIYICRIKEVNFILNEELFKKGREKGNTQEFDTNSLPNIGFWHQRYYYYSRFDEGIKMDYESWYSVTPEEISIYIARLCKGKTVVDAFCGSGGNTIQFSLYCKHVYAIDIDPNKIDISRNNTKVYNCPNNIDFICSDYLKIDTGAIKADIIFLSPPWGGVEYKSTATYSLKDWIEPNIYEIIRVSKQISSNLMFYLPRNTDIQELLGILNDLDLGDTFAEIKLLQSAHKIKAILVCFGDEYNHISVKDVTRYLCSNYKAIQKYQICQLTNLTKVVGLTSFLQAELNYRNSTQQPKVNEFIKYMKDEVLTNEEVVEYNVLDKKKKMNKKSEDEKEKPNGTLVETEVSFRQTKLLDENEYNILRFKHI
jgi:trimethylguanosine synthase